MAFSNEGSRTRNPSKRAYDLNLSAGDGDWPDEPAQGRDWKKLVLVVGLGILSWVATYIGMLELIESNMGALPLVHKAIIGFSVAMLMTMIIWLLDQMFAPIPFATRLAYVGGYVFLSLISIGFGFGFYWKVLESRSESSRSAESAVTQVQSSLHAASTRLTQLSTTLDQLTQVSNEKAEIERVKGTSCPNSRPGDGPRRKLREEDAQRFTFAADFVKGRVGSVDNDLKGLDTDLAKIVSDDKSTIDANSGTRNDFMRALGRKLDITVTGFNAFRTDPQLKQLRSDLAERSEKTVFPDTRGSTFACPDTQLQQALKGVVRAIDQLPDLEKPKIAAVEGSEATIEAFRRLTATFYGALAFKLPPSADELRDLQKKAVQSVEASPAVHKALSGEQVVGLSKRDYIPLAIAVFVDLCLLLVSMSRPINRLHGLVPKMRAAERGPIIQILSRFNEIHRDDEIRQNFEVFRHVVIDFHGAYYAAVPLDAPYKPTAPYTGSYSTEDIEDLKLEAHLLSNLFTSFEKEKIFTRVYSPLLTTRAVKRKLLKQGSKFAHAEAFRIYRFRDGAWSEIILGAVMGAARRVEAEKKKRRLEDQLFTSSAPSLAAANDHSQPARTHAETTLDVAPAPVAATTMATDMPPEPALAAGERRAPARGGFFSRRAANDAAKAASTEPHIAGSQAIADRQATAAASTRSTIAEFGPYASRASREIADSRYRSALPTLRGEDGALDRPRPRRKGTGTTEETAPNRDGDMPAGEIVLFAIPGTAPEAPYRPSAPVVADAPTAAKAEVEAPSAPTPASNLATSDVERMQHLGVVLRRDTAEFTLPVTEATLPGALAALSSLARQAEPAAAPAVIEHGQAQVMTPPPLPAPVVAPPASDATSGAIVMADVADAVIADNPSTEPDIAIEIEEISRRFRPTAAE